jgi:3-methylcrotonyl-CoA carboxylase alpha subunit
VIGAAQTLRADAIHPGYGFLSERAPFARAARDAGLIFVGPSPEAIAAMGDKIEAKRRAREHDVPVVPGYDGAAQDLETMRAEAARIGTPLLVKASAGGGGRGMRVVDDLATFDEAFEAAKREALAAFGDETILLERYVVRPRHIEFQILADEHGTTIHLGERECSIQRRHQKIIEEAPSVALDPALRERMGAAAIRVAKSVGYTNAGTVEFLLDENGEFYFLEMNARLQVEHPVTELVLGIDLVRMQFAIAAGAPLALAQSDIAARGWAIEARINAEDPANAYLPATGTITRFDAPSGPGVRLDAGVRTGSEVSIYYDSMLAKLIAYGPDRTSAVERLTTALETFRIEGVRTNLPLLLRIARDVTFRAGYTTTAFLTEHANFLRSDPTGEPEEAFVLAIAAVLDDLRAWRNAHVGIPVRLTGSVRAISVEGSRAPDDARWLVSGDIEGAMTIEVTGDRIVVRTEDSRCAGRAAVSAGGVDVTYEGREYHFPFAAPPALDTAGAARGGGLGAIVSPMPGKIVKVEVSAGDSVLERDLLVVLEAMKMEHRIEATRDGVIKSVAVVPGALVTGGATLVEMEG